MQEKNPHGTVHEETSAIPGRDAPESAATRRVIGDEDEGPERDVMGAPHEPPATDVMGTEVMGETEGIGPDVMGARRSRSDKAFGDDPERIDE